MAPTRAPLSILSMAQKNQSHELMKQGEKLRQKPAGKPLRNRLETAWKPLGNRLETAGANRWETEWKPSGNRSATRRQFGPANRERSNQRCNPFPFFCFYFNSKPIAAPYSQFVNGLRRPPQRCQFETNKYNQNKCFNFIQTVSPIFSTCFPL